MKLSDILKTVGSGLIANLVPGGGAIISLVNELLPDDKKLPQAATGDQLKNSIATLPPEQQASGLNKEFEYKIKMEEFAVETFKEEVKDKGNARENISHSNMPAVLSVALTLFVIGIVCALFYTEPPTGAREVLFMLLGVVIKEWSNSMHYWYGTTRSSSEKTKLLK